MNTNEQRDAFRELLFWEYGVEEKYITSKIIKDDFEQYDLLDEYGTKATISINFTEMKYIVESPEFTQEINIVL
jgi:hypothetical protein